MVLLHLKEGAVLAAGFPKLQSRHSKNEEEYQQRMKTLRQNQHGEILGKGDDLVVSLDEAAAEAGPEFMAEARRDLSRR